MFAGSLIELQPNSEEQVDEMHNQPNKELKVQNKYKSSSKKFQPGL